MEQSKFFAMLSRMKYIQRWGLMRNTRAENLSEHTLETAYIAHLLALMDGADPARVVLCALYHDCSETITGDLPTPVKYRNDELRQSYHVIERAAGEKLHSLLPGELRPGYSTCMFEQDPHILRIVKAADRLSALVKCTEELRMGNSDFQSAYAAQLAALHAMAFEPADRFTREFLPACSNTLDELSRP